ncbi:YqeG family HAD IIIA-type phosphatase [Vulcanococcus sp. Clear-D1]|uniref:YqeG family HAD IIIA-type phosphatase n=1 Tax=Vulcanococcus sp. Clear-D1 TaxID=2766970 RepID=UPI00198C1ABC|nr:YqeG family HAD IIIA-type phosphatase [Vulcanococcus sp. Clear-D1]MBD1193417.1 YqeG family HAD IIIA-type phosphatase [Vulcanococcus sp. Clear-D1]
MSNLSLPQLLQPNLVAPGTLAALPLHQLLAQGIRALVLDVDRTLLPRRGSELPPAVEAWLRRAQQTLPLHLFSNNPSRSRIGAVADQLGVSYTTSAGKPRRGPLRRVIEQLDLPHSQVAIVGDRVFTDVLAGNRLGLYTVLVKPVNPEGEPCPHDHWQRLEVQLARLAGATLS